MSKVNFEHLFEPLQVGPITVPNRICETTNTINSSMIPGEVDENFRAHHGAKAKGGTGWIGSETWLLNVPFPEEAPDEVGLSVGFAARFGAYQNPPFIEGMKKFVDEVHAEGSVAAIQLTHLCSVWSPSAVPSIGAQDYMPHVMGEAEIEFCLQTYADAAATAKSIGADAIEMHCAHETMGYTFLSPVTNKRDDKWGGGPEGRVQFVLEALRRIRAAAGDGIAVGIRISGAEFRRGGYDLMGMREMLYMIGEEGLLDFVDIDAGHCWGAPSYVPNSYYAHAQFREFGLAAKTDLAEMDPKPAVLFTGRVNDPVLAEELLRDGICDLVGMVRAGIADPDFAIKAKEGRIGEIRRCISCTRCIDEASEPATFPYTPTCSINPQIGREIEWAEKFVPTDTPKNVVVVGGGIAGCEAARIAALRGHKVTLLEQGKKLGGQLLIAMKAPGRDSFEDQAYFEENEMVRAGVEVKLETNADIETIKALSPDAVVIATGSAPSVPDDVPGIDMPHVVQGWDVMLGKATVGDRVAIISMEDYYETPCVAEYLTEKGKHVEVFHKSVHLATDVARYSIGMVLRRMEDCGVTVHPNLLLNEVKADSFELLSSFGDHTYQKEGFDSIVLVCGSKSVNALYYELKAEGSIAEVHIAGSAWLPRKMAEASGHGATIGLAL